jgi:hypothetical protein
MLAGVCATGNAQNAGFREIELEVENIINVTSKDCAQKQKQSGLVNENGLGNG